MQAITTKFHGVTNTKPSRISATSASGHRIYISTSNLPPELDTKMTIQEECHKWVALQLCKKLGWTGRLVGGGTKAGYVFVFDSEGETILKNASLEIHQYHAAYDSDCKGGCPAMDTIKQIESEVGSSAQWKLPQAQFNLSQRIHNAQRGN